MSTYISLLTRNTLSLSFFNDYITGKDNKRKQKLTTLNEYSCTGETPAELPIVRYGKPEEGQKGF